MDYGLFIPIANNGWIPSATSPQYMPTFELNKQIVQKAEGYGFKFALSMIKLRGYGGETEYWDYALESFTLMAGLAAVTKEMRLYASVATPTLHPAMVARMAVTIDSIAHDRFGINIVAGWNKSEYEQMGMWPGDEFYDFRYDYASEYVTIMKELWETGRSDFKGKFFTLDDCRLLPMPTGDIKVVSAGASPRGRQFTAEHCDYNFTGAPGGADGLAYVNGLLAEAADKAGRPTESYPLYMVILGATDAEARAKVDHYNEGVDLEAIAFMKGQASLDKKSRGTSASMVAARPEAVHDGAIVGSPATVAAQLNELSAVAGTGGIMLMFDDFLEGTEVFGREVMPLLD
ncbi:MAG: LLM class flavin-dependent oxidoreductase [Trebonia sp.]